MNNPNGIREILELYDFGELSALEAKQALTSLIKELVAEAKPEKQNTENMGDTFKVNWARGYNLSADQFEQNLLKKLEEEL